MVEKHLTRRDFLRGTAGAALLGAAATGAQEAETARAKVVLIRDENAVAADGKANQEVLSWMLDEAMTTLLEEDTAQAAWKQIIRPEDVVGIKSNESGPPRTPPELESIIRQNVIAAGVAPDNVDADDRGVRRNAVFQRCTALINVRPIRTHHWAGVGSLLKNYIMFSDSPPSWHEDSCANLAGLWELPAVKGKTRLNVLVMLTPLFHGKGPHHYNKEYTWPYRGLIVSTDPVAADATGLRILEVKRLAHFGEAQPFTVSPKHIRVAQDKFHLGIADPSRIDLVKLGWTDDALI